MKAFTIENNEIDWHREPSERGIAFAATVRAELERHPAGHLVRRVTCWRDLGPGTAGIYNHPRREVLMVRHKGWRHTLHHELGHAAHRCSEGYSWRRVMLRCAATPYLFLSELAWRKPAACVASYLLYSVLPLWLLVHGQSRLALAHLSLTLATLSYIRVRRNIEVAAERLAMRTLSDVGLLRTISEYQRATGHPLLTSVLSEQLSGLDTLTLALEELARRGGRPPQRLLRRLTRHGEARVRLASERGQTAPFQPGSLMTATLPHLWQRTRVALCRDGRDGAASGRACAAGTAAGIAGGAA